MTGSSQSTIRDRTVEHIPSDIVKWEDETTDLFLYLSPVVRRSRVEGDGVVVVDLVEGSVGGLRGDGEWTD